jgi:hypothetical protein
VTICSLVDSEILVNICQITHRHNQKDTNLHNYVFLANRDTPFYFPTQWTTSKATSPITTLDHCHKLSDPHDLCTVGDEVVLLSIYVDNVMIYEMTSPNEYVWNKCSDMWLVTSPQHSLVSQTLTQLLLQVCTPVQRGSLIWTFSGRGFHSGHKWRI